MIKYLMLSLVGYYIYNHYFIPKKINDKSKSYQSPKQNNTQGDYVDYEEVE